MPGRAIARTVGFAPSAASSNRRRFLRLVIVPAVSMQARRLRTSRPAGGYVKQACASCDPPNVGGPASGFLLAAGRRIAHEQDPAPTLVYRMLDFVRHVNDFKYEKAVSHANRVF